MFGANDRHVHARNRWTTGLIATALLVLPGTMSRGDVAQIRVFEPPVLRTDVHPSEFFPDLVIVEVGDTVRWVWQAETHTVTSGDIEACEPDGRWQTPLSELQPIYEHVFQEPGTFFYYCDHHCLLAMWGAVVVRSPTPLETSSWGRIKSWFRK